jgi:hypothetical protein
MLLQKVLTFCWKGKNASQPEPSQQLSSMHIDYIYNPWKEKKFQQLFLPNEGEHSMEIFTRRIGFLKDVCISPEG